MSRINGSEDPRQLRANRLVVPNFQIAVWRAPAAHLRDADGRSHVEAGPSLGWAGEKEDNCDMIQIIYASAATKPFTRGDLVVRKNSI